jgi:hypothetical protein
VCCGEDATLRVKAWVSKHYHGKLVLKVRCKRVCWPWVRLERQDWLLLVMAASARWLAASSVCLWPSFCKREPPTCQCSGIAASQRRCNLMPPSWQVRSVPEDTDTAQAVRLVAEELHSPDVVVMAADLVCNVPLQARCEHACKVSGLCVHNVLLVKTPAYVQSLEVACGCHKVCK